MKERNIVVMGGSFNPPTIAHYRIMHAAMNAVSADLGFFVPVSFPYLKRKMTKACFSQWYDCCFEVGGRRYHTAEQFMMARKAELFGDEVTLERIMAADDPRVHNPNEWQGENLLGFALMEARDRLRAAASA